MKLEDLVDIEKFTESINPPSKSIFHTWSDTALEVSGDKYKSIQRIRNDYMGLSEAELTTRHIITFIEALLYEMPSDDMKMKLIRVEAFQFKKFV